MGVTDFKVVGLLLIQWHFLPEMMVSPYAGVGVNYTVFYNEDSGDADEISYSDEFGFALQGGIDYFFSERWGVNADVKKVFLSTDVSVVSGTATVPAKVDIDPWIFGIGVVFKP